MFGFPATTFTIRTIMLNGFLVTGSTEVEGGIGSKATGGTNTPTLITLLLAVTCDAKAARSPGFSRSPPTQTGP